MCFHSYVNDDAHVVHEHENDYVDGSPPPYFDEQGLPTHFRNEHSQWQVSYYIPYK